MGLASLYMVGTHAQRTALLMTWTIADDENDVIHIRAILSLRTDADEVRKLINALERRIRKELPDARQPES